MIEKIRKYAGWIVAALIAAVALTGKIIAEVQQFLADNPLPGTEPADSTQTVIDTLSALSCCPW